MISKIYEKQKFEKRQAKRKEKIMNGQKNKKPSNNKILLHLCLLLPNRQNDEQNIHGLDAH